MIPEQDIDLIMEEFLPEFQFFGDVATLQEDYKIRYKTSSFGISSDILYLSSGVFMKRKSYILLKNIDSIAKIEHFIHRKRKVIKLSVDFSGKKLGDLRKMNGIPVAYFEVISNQILKNIL